MKERLTKQVSARKLIVLLLLDSADQSGEDSAPITGTTRLQKLVFLTLKQSEDFLEESDSFRFDLNFRPDRFGPADLDLYQDLELLRLSGWISIDERSGPDSQTTPVPAPTFETLLGESEGGHPPLPEDIEETDLSFDYLMGDDTEEEAYAEAEEESEHVYAITPVGTEGLHQIRASTRKPETFDKLADVCHTVKREYISWPLRTLLRHVYRTYPDMTVKSEIRAQVLR